MGYKNIKRVNDSVELKPALIASHETLTVADSVVQFADFPDSVKYVEFFVGWY